MREFIITYRKGILGTILFHILLLLYLFLSGIVVKLPLPGDKQSSLFVDFGYDNHGFGTIEPDEAAPPKETKQDPVQASVKPVAEEENPVITQNTEEVDYASPDKKTDKPKIKPEVKKDQDLPIIEKPKIKEPDVRGMYPGGKGKNPGANGNNTGSTSTGQGNDPGYIGNKGRPDGKPGGGDGGGGTGTGGFSKGPGGFETDLVNRSMTTAPTIEDNSQKTGVVIVEIIVDKLGNVTSATPGAKGSTTTDAYLLNKAREAAFHTKFSKKADMIEQRGRIKFDFKVRSN